MAMLIHLNGAPGVGKSTLAEQYAAARPGVLACDIDRLRCLVGGWQERFQEVGEIVRPLASAMITAHLDGGRDVVLPQLLADEHARDRFRSAATDHGHHYVHVLVRASAGTARDRFYRRSDADPLHAVVRERVEADGGGVRIDELDRLLSSRHDEAGRVPWAHVVQTDGSFGAALRSLTALVDGVRAQLDG